jgi:hypothetical protein
MRPRLLALAGTVALVALGIVARPVTSSRAGANDPRLDGLKLVLRGLITAQEQYYAEHGTYTTEMSALKSLGVTLPDSAFAHVIQAGGRSWNGAAYHRGLRGKSCVVYVGLRADFPTPPVTEKDSTKATTEGLPVCDRP